MLAWAAGAIKHAATASRSAGPSSAATMLTSTVRLADKKVWYTIGEARMSACRSDADGAADRMVTSTSTGSDSMGARLRGQRGCCSLPMSAFVCVILAK
jgi:hypothetical protein